MPLNYGVIFGVFLCTIFMWLLFTLLYIKPDFWFVTNGKYIKMLAKFIYLFCLYLMNHLVYHFIRFPLTCVLANVGKIIFVFCLYMMVCFLVCFLVTIFTWLLFTLFSNMGVPLHSLYIILIEMANVGKCIYVFCLYMGGGGLWCAFLFVFLWLLV